MAVSWTDGSLLGVDWRAFVFHLPEGKWWALEANRGSEGRSAPDDETDLLIEAFGDRATEVAVD